jgi:hypothetical protein
MRKITIELSDTAYELLQVLAPGGSVGIVLMFLADHAQQGVYRPGSWERGWLTQAFGSDWTEKLEPGDPYGRPDSSELCWRSRATSSPKNCRGFSASWRRYASQPGNGSMCRRDRKRKAPAAKTSCWTLKRRPGAWV